MIFFLCLDGARPGKDEVMEIRKQMLLYVKCLILKGQGIHEDELQSILNYLTTVHEVRVITQLSHHRAWGTYSDTYKTRTFAKKREKLILF